MNKSLSSGLAIALGAWLAACGNGDDGAPGGGSDAGPVDGAIAIDAGEGGPPGDASRDGAGDAAADASDAAGDGAAPCGWTAYQDGLSGANVGDVRFDPRTNTPVAYASAGSALYRSSDSGQTWTQTGRSTAGALGRIATPGTDPSVLLAASSAGVLRSADTGKTWSVLSFAGIAVSVLGVTTAQPLRVYAAVDGGGVFRSDDGGASWGAASQGFPAMSTQALEVAPDNPDEVVAAGFLLDAQGLSAGVGAVLRTTDGGHTWQEVVQPQTDGFVSTVHRCPADPAVLYGALTAGVIRSSDRGATWGTPTPLDHPVDDVAIAGAGCDEVYAMSEGQGPRRSTDGGATFGPAITQGFDSTPPEGHLAAAPGVGGAVLIGNHAGIWYSTAGGASWHAASGLLGLLVSGMSVSPLSPSHVWMSTWGSGVWQRSSSAQPWTRVPESALPADYVFTVAADPYTAGRVVVGAFPTLYASADGATFTPTSVSQDEHSVAFGPGSGKAIYVATQTGGVYASTGAAGDAGADGGGAPAFAPANAGLGSVVDVRAIVADPGSPQTLYAGTNGTGVYKSADGAATWTNVLGPSQVTVCLAVVPGASGGVYACVQGGGVQRSADGGTTWTDASQGLPTQDVGTMVVDPVSGDLYATAGALVYLKHGTQAWAPVDACSPGVGLSALAVVTSGSARSLLAGAGGSVFAHPL